MQNNKGSTFKFLYTANWISFPPVTFMFLS